MSPQPQIALAKQTTYTVAARECMWAYTVSEQEPMDKYPQSAPASQSLVAFAAFVIIIAGLRSATPIVVPFLLSAFIAVISAPPLFWLRQKRIPMALALLIVIGAITLVIIGIAAILGGSLDDFSRNVPAYRARLMEQSSALLAWMGVWRLG